MELPSASYAAAVGSPMRPRALDLEPSPRRRRGVTPEGDRDAASATRSAMHEIHVTVVSAEEAEIGIAEFWSGGRMIGYTRLADGDLMLRIEPGDDGDPVELGATATPATTRRPTGCWRATDPSTRKARHEDRFHRRPRPRRLQQRPDARRERAPRPTPPAPRPASTRPPARASARCSAGAEVVVDVSNSPSFEDTR